MTNSQRKSTTVSFDQFSVQILTKIPLAARMFLRSAWVLLLFFSLSSIAHLNAQDPQSLREKTLIVVIPTEQKSIEILTKRLETGHDKRTQDDLEVRIKRQQLFEKELINAMAQFNYSQWAYVPDTMLRNRGSLEHLPVYSAKGALVTINLKDTWFLKRGVAESGSEGLILCNGNLSPWPRPFPGFYKLNRFMAVLENMFGKRTATWRPLQQIVQKMNQKLDRWSTKYQ